MPTTPQPDYHRREQNEEVEGVKKSVFAKTHTQQPDKDKLTRDNRLKTVSHEAQAEGGRPGSKTSKSERTKQAKGKTDGGKGKK